MWFVGCVALMMLVCVVVVVCVLVMCYCGLVGVLLFDYGGCVYM